MGLHQVCVLLMALHSPSAHSPLAAQPEKWLDVTSQVASSALPHCSLSLFSLWHFPVGFLRWVDEQQVHETSIRDHTLLFGHGACDCLVLPLPWEVLDKHQPNTQQQAKWVLARGSTSLTSSSPQPNFKANQTETKRQSGDSGWDVEHFGLENKGLQER